jgi:hypothetical protein
VLRVEVLRLADIRLFRAEDQGRRLGTFLLERVIGHAKAMVVKSIVGEARAEEGQNQEHLLE